MALTRAPFLVRDIRNNAYANHEIASYARAWYSIDRN